jgi:5'-3' exoribonuclease 1
MILSLASSLQDVCGYIETLFRIIKPKRVFYMAVDGCAPRAKMNQQRARRYVATNSHRDKQTTIVNVNSYGHAFARFRTAKDAEEARKKAAREVL